MQQVLRLSGKSGQAPGFSLVEIMIVVVIIGLLAAIAIPAFLNSRNRSQATAIANNFRVYSQAFEVFATDTGNWPPDSNPGGIPTGMEDSLRSWNEPTPVGGQWDWDRGVLGIQAGVTLINSTASNGMLERIDRILDDGNLSTGRFQRLGSGVTLILEP
jgi:type IV pilus assembly protein PilA